MMIATTAGGIFMYAVHFPALAKMPEAEYGVFTTLLQILNLMLIPAIGLQTVFTQQTAAATTPQEQRQLTGAVRAVLLGTFLLWVGVVVAVLFFQASLIESLRIANPAALWITVATALPMLWLPMMQGLLQGTQNFLWLGWTAILNGFGRFVAVSIIVLLFHGYATGSIAGALLGMLSALSVQMWQTRSFWLGPSLPFVWRPWLARVVPLTAGLGAAQFIFAADMIMVQSFFKGDTGLYGAAGTIARGLVLFTGPLALVMFPKIVRSAARSEKTDVLAQALAATGLLGGLAALGCTIFPELPFRVMNKPSYLPIAPLIPRFAWCMLPLAMANVLINNLLARSRFRVVPWLAGVALAYGTALIGVGKFFKTGDKLHDFKLVVQTLGVFNLVLLGVAMWFTARGTAESKMEHPK